MEIVKIPRMDKEEYDTLIGKGYICRIAFQGEKYPYIAPFLYVFMAGSSTSSPQNTGRSLNISGKAPTSQSRWKNTQKTCRVTLS